MAIYETPGELSMSKIGGSRYYSDISPLLPNQVSNFGFINGQFISSPIQAMSYPDSGMSSK